MPLTACPSCGSRYGVRRQDVGRTIRCTRCETRFPAEVAPDPRRFLRGSHPVGLVVGVLCLAAAAALVGWVVWAVVQAGDLNRAVHGVEGGETVRRCLQVAAGCLVAGAILVARWWLTRDPDPF